MTATVFERDCVQHFKAQRASSIEAIVYLFLKHKRFHDAIDHLEKFLSGYYGSVTLQSTIISCILLGFLLRDYEGDYTKACAYVQKAFQLEDDFSLILISTTPYRYRVALHCLKAWFHVESRHSVTDVITALSNAKELCSPDDSIASMGNAERRSIHISICKALGIAVGIIQDFPLKRFIKDMLNVSYILFHTSNTTMSEIRRIGEDLIERRQATSKQNSFLRITKRIRYGDFWRYKRHIKSLYVLLYLLDVDVANTDSVLI